MLDFHQLHLPEKGHSLAVAGSAKSSFVVENE
jgi:hypothetical protein